MKSMGPDHRRAVANYLVVRNRITKASEVRAHAFKIFRIGLDMCAECSKPRGEHPKVRR
jgi:hypothetical protein